MSKGILTTEELVADVAEPLVAPFEYIESPHSRNRSGSKKGVGQAGLSEAEIAARFQELFPTTSIAGRLPAPAGSPNRKPTAPNEDRRLPGQENSLDALFGPQLDASYVESDHHDSQDAKTGNPYFDDASGLGRESAPGGRSQTRFERRWTDEDVAQSVAQQSKLAEERGRKEGFGLGVNSARNEAAVQIAAEREHIFRQAAQLSEGFLAEKQDYFEQLEIETVRLALAVAARILRREVQMDPLVLSNTVRVALGQLAQSTRVKIVVPEEDCDLWRQGLKLFPSGRSLPEVIGDSAMCLGECRMETELGTAELGLLPQLKEIERSFFDRTTVRSEAEKLSVADREGAAFDGQTDSSGATFREQRP